MVNREVVGAHYGLRDWLAQRVTAVVMMVYTAFFLVVLTSLPAFDYWSWKSLWQVPAMRYATLLMMACLLFHAWIGVRNIFMDYIKDAGLRLIFYTVVILALFGYGAWTVQILWSA